MLTIAALTEIAMELFADGHFAQAETLLRKAQQTAVWKFGSHSFEEGFVLVQMARFYERNQLPAEAAHCDDRVKTILVRLSKERALNLDG